MPRVKIIARNFMDMVGSLPAFKLDGLYENSFICEAILRSLPSLAKKYVLQMLYIDNPVSAKSMEEWVAPEGLSKHKASIDRLIQLRIFTESVERKKEISYKLNSTYQRSLQKHMIYGGVLPREPMAAAAVRLPKLEELDVYAMEQWDSFLLQLINSTTQSSSSSSSTSLSSISPSLMKLFQRGLLLQDREREGPRLTESGFQFLLMDTNAQLWYIVREYISSTEERGGDASDVISFLLELSFHFTGQAYRTDTLTETQRNTIRDVADLGLVKIQQGRKESWFIPTKLASNLSFSLSSSSSRKTGFVAVETNFRVYAYSSSRLHCEILRLFSRIEYRLPNLIVAAITKESLYGAFENGITAEQIISFLQQNAHPRAALRIPSVPENVTDQIRLWENDLNRVELTTSYLYDEFPSKDVFEMACCVAQENGGLLWEDAKRMKLVVRGDVHSHMRESLQRLK